MLLYGGRGISDDECLPVRGARASARGCDSRCGSRCVLDGHPGEGHGFKPKAKHPASAGSSAQEAAASPMMAH